MALYQESNGLDHENFANFSFPQGTDDNILPQVPPTDHRAATDMFNAITSLIEDLQKFQENLSVVHNLLFVSSQYSY
jgi:hypothetical protein